MIEVLIDICPKDENFDEVKKMILSQREYTLENHKGCFTYIPSLSLIDNKSFYIKEKWYTPRDLVNYRNSKGFLEYNEKLKTLIASDNIVESFEYM